MGPAAPAAWLAHRAASRDPHRAGALDFPPRLSLGQGHGGELHPRALSCSFVVKGNRSKLGYEFADTSMTEDIRSSDKQAASLQLKIQSLPPHMLVAGQCWLRAGPQAQARPHGAPQYYGPLVAQRI